RLGWSRGRYAVEGSGAVPGGLSLAWAGMTPGGAGGGASSARGVLTRGTNEDRVCPPGACATAGPAHARTATAASRLDPVRLRVLLTRTVVGRFLRNENVMRMALLHRRG